MTISDRSEVSRWLETVGYYRLSAYWLPFEHPPEGGRARSKLFLDGTTFERVRDLYVFDRKLRLLLLEAIERIEINLRSRWTYHMSHAHGPHAHLNHLLFKGGTFHPEQLARLARAVDRSDEVFIHHYKNKYTEPYSPPLWSVTELMSLGELSKWFQATNDQSIKSEIGRELGLPTREATEGVLQVLSLVRNVCAHHSRLWNRRFVKRIPNIRRFRSDLVVEVNDGQKQLSNRIYNTMAVLQQMLHNQATDSSFPERLKSLVDEVQDDDRLAMGFPDDWRDRPAWNL